jgi:serine/threonine protein kinase
MTDEAQDPFVKGQRIDRYEIREHIGQGGMGTVYRAVDSKLGRTVALKTVVAHKRGAKLTEEIRERFMREALAASRVDHRNVVQVLDFGFAEDGTPYMVMEYLRGRSLSEALKRAKEPLAIDYVADVLLSVCAALRACHHVGIIHRDLKPANIFLCDTDTGWEVKVLDFGISKAHAADELTQDGQIIGTPQYLSPEQIEGTVGPESDQYALGVLLYACLTQRLPYSSYQGVRLLRAIADGKFDPPRTLRADLPEGLEAIVLRAMHVAPKERFGSIHALGQKLWEFASPRGQAQWKAFYFHTPTAGQPPQPSTTHVTEPQPELRALAREQAPRSATDGEPVAPLEPAPPRRADSTASLEPQSGAAKTEPQPSTVGPSHFAVTRTATPSGVADAAGGSQSDIAGESALGLAQDAGRRSPGPRAIWLRVAVGLAIGAAIAIAVQRASRTDPSAAHAGGAVIETRPTARVPAAPPPRTAAPTAPPPRPVTVEPNTQAARSEQPVETAADAGAAQPDRPVESAKRRYHATRRRPAPKTDQNGIGIPTE